ncbi:MAG TPA: competence/damage-inducible protein A [Bryobacteraceae bacterium]
MKRAEIIAVGSELLTAAHIDTNSLFITEQLNRLGIDVAEKHIVLDDLSRLIAAIRGSLSRVEFVFLSGGLGPTEDDVTRSAAAAALGRELVFSAEQEEILMKRFARLNRKMAENNRRQAYLIDGAEALPNPHGTAPGQLFRTDDGALFLLPGPPRELKPMMSEQVVPILESMLPPQVLRTRTFRVAGMGESDLDALIAPIYAKYTNPTTTVLAGAGDISVTLCARCQREAEAEALLREVGDPIADLLGVRAYSFNGDPLEVTVGNLLRARGQTVATAESCTGGMVAVRLTEYPGSSDFFAASFVTYTDEQKQRLLGIPADMLKAHTAVSEPVAIAMAENARARSGATYAVAVTGYAGPSGGTEENPVGTVFIGIATPKKTRALRFRYGADRNRVRLLSTQTALDLLRRAILGVDLSTWR